MPRGRPITTGTGKRGPRVAVSPVTANHLDALALPGESRPVTLARVVEEHIARKEKE